MIQRIHILGASGSGTSTLARALSEKLGYQHFDTDNYYWLPSEEPFTQPRPIDQRRALLERDLAAHENWVLSGSLCGWGDLFIRYFELVIFLWIPSDIRMSRLLDRERERYGIDMEPGGKRYLNHKTFMEWAARYDSGGPEIRSKALHEAWLAELTCPVLRLEEDMTVEARVDAVLQKLNGLL
jgi:adenylate kinase family enzyme